MAWLAACGTTDATVNREEARLSMVVAHQQEAREADLVQEGGLSARVKLAAVSSEGMQLELDGDQLLLKLVQDTAELEVLPEAMGLPRDWKSYDAMRLHYVNAGETPLGLRVQVMSARGYLEASQALTLREAGNLELELAELWLISRGKGRYPPVSLRLTVAGEADSSSLKLQRIELLRAPDTYPRACADEFGQRIRRDWPEKIHSVSELKAQAAAERERLSAQPATLPGRSAYGGWTQGPTFEATGFFRLEQGPTQDELTAWWLVDPEGNPFWSLGVTGVRPKYPDSRSELTLYAGRAHLFEALPPREGAFSEAYEGEMVSPYTWNLLRKWESLDEWRELVSRRLASWGVNTLGNWSDEGVLEHSALPYTRFLRSNGPGAARLGESRLVDVFDPSWQQYLDSAFAPIAAHKEEARLLGYFVDNEQPWGRLGLLEHASPKSALRKAWLELLKDTYSTLPALNQAWGTNFSDWEEAKQATRLPEVPAAQAAQLALETRYAETYFQRIAQTLNAYDPNHLYLGCRFTKRLKPEHVIAAAGRYCDVLTINNYSLVPTKERMYAWHRLSGGRPILIGEHHLPLASDRQLPPRYRNFSEEERLHYYQAYVKAWAEMPFSVGSHWYQWVDQPLTGRASDGENQTVGIVDITDQPHLEMVRALKTVSKQVYGWHQAAVP